MMKLLVSSYVRYLFIKIGVESFSMMLSFRQKDLLFLIFQIANILRTSYCRLSRLFVNVIHLLTTELDYSWKRNTAFLLYKQLTNGGE